MERRGGGAAELELPGFRFHPTEEELLEFYLRQAAQGSKLRFDIIPTVHLYRHDPWDLPALAPPIVAAGAEMREWYFFVPRDGGARRHQQQAGGARPSRTTERGFWKATGSDRAVRCAADPKRLIGLKKTLVYYQGRAPRGTKTDWIMNEYRLPKGEEEEAAAGVVLCKVYRKAVSLKELEQRVAMEELARAATPSACSHSAGSPADSSGAVSSSSDQLMMPAVPCMKKELADAVVVRPATMVSLPQLEVARPAPQQQMAEWMQDPFLTQPRSPWTESWSPYYASSVLNF